MNSDHIKKCEIFHLAQPISLIKILSAKALFAVGGIFVQYLVLATVNCVVLSVISGILGIPSLSLGLNAVLNNIPYVISGLILITPLVWFANSVFRKLGAMKAGIFLAVFEVIRGLFSLSWDISLYSPWDSLTEFCSSLSMSHRNTFWFPWISAKWLQTWQAGDGIILGSIWRG